MILLGSGGHTGEMLQMLSALTPESRFRRRYVVSTGDVLSYKKAVEFERKLSASKKQKKDSASAEPDQIEIHQIPRARDVGQSWLTTPLSCVNCFWAALKVFLGGASGTRRIPELVVCNGPGMAVLVIAVVLGFKFVGLAQTRTIYVESFARVNSLSLSGKILYPLVDRMIVQWPQLRVRYPRAEYHGFLV